MENHTISVTVQGRANTGKSTIVEIIHSALTRAGIEVEFGNLLDEPPEETRLRRVQAVSKKTRVVLFEAQIQRVPREAED